MLKVKNITDHLSNQHCPLQLAQHKKCCKINSSLTWSNLIWKIRWAARKTNVNYKMILLTTKCGIKGTAKLEQMKKRLRLNKGYCLQVMWIAYIQSGWIKCHNQTFNALVRLQCNHSYKELARKYYIGKQLLVHQELFGYSRSGLDSGNGQLLNGCKKHYGLLLTKSLLWTTPSTTTSPKDLSTTELQKPLVLRFLKVYVYFCMYVYLYTHIQYTHVYAYTSAGTLRDQS